MTDGRIFLPLLCIILVSVLCQLYIADAAVMDYSSVNGSSTVNIGEQSSGQFGSSGVLSDLATFNLGGVVIAVNIVGGVVSLLLVGMIISVIAGIHFEGKVLGSGIGFSLSDKSVTALTYGIVFYGMWLIFSALASPFIWAIPFFGVPIYFILTLVYCLGVFDLMGV